MPGILVDKQLKNWYPNGNIYVEVVDLSKTKYPNRDALRKAHDIYLDAMYQFVKRCLDKVQGATAEELIRDALGMSPHDDVEEKIEISDIAHLVRTYWYDSFEAQFEVIDRHYEARSVVGLMVEGRNRASHRPWDLDPGFTRTHLFLIAELLSKINKPNEQREVETIQDDLFSDDTAERLAEAEQRLTDAETEGAEHKKSLATAEKRLETAEAKKNDYKERLETTSKELKKIKAELKTSEKRLTTTSNQFATATTEKEADRDEVAVKVVEMRINSSGSKPMSWRRIREKLGLKHDQFHKGIRHSAGYRKAVIDRIKSLKAQEGGWEYSGKLEVLTGIEITEEELS